MLINQTTKIMTVAIFVGVFVVFVLGGWFVLNRKKK